MRRNRRDAEVDRELEFHVEMETERHVRDGLDPAEARRRALVSFGGVERYKEATLDAHSHPALQDATRDMRQAARALLRAPAFALVTVLTLALGIGAATAMFSVLDGVLLRPLVYGDADRLHLLYESNGEGGLRGTSFPSFQDWERQATAFAAMTFIRGDEFRLRGDDGTQRLLAGYVSDSFFRTVGTQPLLGRTFEAGDGDVVVLSYDLWQRSFGGDAAVLGATLSTADATYQVIGVMPRGFRLPQWADVWVPILSLPPEAAFALTRRDLRVDAEAWGLRRADTSVAAAEEDLGRVISGLADEYADATSDQWRHASLVDVRQQVVGDSSEQIRIAALAVALLLLIVCVNVAGLQLARATARTRELAVRAALGAGRWRLVRQLLAESALIAVLGGVLGVLLALLAVDTLSTTLPGLLPRMDELAVDLRVLAFATVVTMAVALATGVLPALRSGATAPGDALRGGSRGGGTTAGTHRLRSGLVIAQVALAMVLTVTSGLLLRSLWHLQDTELGYRIDGTVALRVFPPPRYADEAAALALYEELKAAVRSVPGVDDVALANHLPMAGGMMPTPVETGGPPPPDGPLAVLRTVSPEYFDVMGSRRVQGRLFDASHGAGEAGLVMNTAAARKFFGDEDPTGRSVTIRHAAQGRDNYGEPIHATILGVVESERFLGVEADAPPAVFVPHTLMVWPNISIVARTRLPPEQLLPALRRAVHQVDRDIPVAGPGRQAEWRPLTAFAADALQQRQTMSLLLAAFAAAALALAALGLFGVTAYLVERRTHEIGIRSALGAPRTALVTLVGRHALLLAGAGIVVGLAASFAAARLVASQLVGVGMSDPVVIGSAAAVFLAVTLLASALPAVRATRIAPTQALRAE